MTAIDELRRMLDERGVEWKAKALYFMDVGTVFSASSDFEWIVIWDKNANNLSITNYKNGLTPAQVIAATLGDNDATRTRQLDAIDEILRTLNAEVTNDNIKYDLYSELHDMVSELANLTDESLNPDSRMSEFEHNVDGSYKCPKCGCVVDYDIRGDGERIITMDDYVIPFNHCPKCGRRVVNE